MASWLEFFGEAAREQVRHGIRVEYAGVDAETNTFVWLRSFADEATRVRQKDAFYGSDWWLERESFAMDHVLEYEVAFLEAAIVRSGDDLEANELPPSGDPAGSATHADDPPDGWMRSRRATFARLP
jgi:hypothetical protein